MRILIASADADRLQTFADLFDRQNLQAQTVTTAEAMLEAAQQGNFSLLLIDQQIGKASGTSIVQQLRISGHGTPALMIAAAGDVQEEIDALDVGVDDVIREPVQPELLLARVRAMLRRCEPGEAVVLKYEDLQLNLASLQVRRAEQLITATSRELAVLEYLLRHPERVISRAELVDAVWDRSQPPESNVVDVFVARLRRKIDRPFAVSLIHTIVNRGYMLTVTKPRGEVVDTDVDESP